MNYKFDFKDIAVNGKLPQALAEFLDYLSTIKGKSNNTIRAYRIDLSVFFRFLKIYKGKTHGEKVFEDIDISDIDDDFIRSIKLTDLYAYISFAQKYRNNGSYARARKVASVKSFFKFLTGKAKILKENPALELESPKIEKRNPIFLNLDESKKLLRSVDPTDHNFERDYCILTLFLNCGMRISELCGINISNIKDDTLTIIGKGDKERTVYLNRACIRSVENYMLVRGKKYAPISPTDKDALFISEKKCRINKRSVERMVKKYVQAAGLDQDKYTPHKLRHTAATLMYKHGKVDIRSLQEILGHESVSTTQIYTHVDDDELRKAVNSNPLNDIE
ncbi:tyrosine recombinase XerC [Clostridium oryzae]|uniref:Tyrosine recombinase XerD n=1 Tax=Clostridium oryzae TaxID=1450648 RepID=A0A1V4I9B4_9CLOT|nr:tyrosine recombinase XerC [Clostridium oryzae]OPJ56582.1 tyrosine recombinase XerD [Clostridium oryzae]